MRVYLLPDQRNSRQTRLQRKTQSPVYNEDFTYAIPYRDVLKRTLLVKVQDVQRSATSTLLHRVVGHALLTLANVNLLKGVHIWKRIRPADQVLVANFKSIILNHLLKYLFFQVFIYYSSFLCICYYSLFVFVFYY